MAIIGNIPYFQTNPFIDPDSATLIRTFGCSALWHWFDSIVSDREFTPGSISSSQTWNANAHCPNVGFLRNGQVVLVTWYSQFFFGSWYMLTYVNMINVIQMVRFFPTPEAMMHLHVAMFRDWTARMNKKNQQVFAVRDTTGWKSNPHFSRHTTSKPMWVAPTILAWQIFRGAQKKTPGKSLKNSLDSGWSCEILTLTGVDHKWS